VNGRSNRRDADGIRRVGWKVSALENDERVNLRTNRFVAANGQRVARHYGDVARGTKMATCIELAVRTWRIGGGKC